MARKSPPKDVASDLALLRQLLSSQPQTRLATIFPSPDESMNRLCPKHAKILDGAMVIERDGKPVSG